MGGGEGGGGVKRVFGKVNVIEVDLNTQCASALDLLSKKWRLFQNGVGSVAFCRLTTFAALSLSLSLSRYLHSVSFTCVTPHLL